MDERLERNDSLVSWMIAGGARLEAPDPRQMQHLVALRDAGRGAGPSFSPLAWLTARISTKAGVTASAAGAAVPAASTACCPA